MSKQDKIGHKTRTTSPPGRVSQPNPPQVSHLVSQHTSPFSRPVITLLQVAGPGLAEGPRGTQRQRRCGKSALYPRKREGSRIQVSPKFRSPIAQEQHMGNTQHYPWPLSWTPAREMNCVFLALKLQTLIDLNHCFPTLNHQRGNGLHNMPTPS